MDATFNPYLALLIVLLVGTVGGVLASLAYRRQIKTLENRAVEPFIGFLMGVVAGAVGVIGWIVF